MKGMEVLLLNCPKMDLRAPSIALATLKAICESLDVGCFALDLNIELWRRFVESDHGKLWAYDDNILIDPDLFKSIESEFENHVQEIVVQRLNGQVPKIIGLSIFSIFNFVTARAVLKVLRKIYPKAEVVLGGPGISFRNQHEVVKYFTEFKCAGLFNDFIFGESAQAFSLYVKGARTGQGINNFFSDSNSARIVSLIPDYSDFNFALYPKAHTEPGVPTAGPNNWLYITGSKGCVRNCTFCDVGEIWPMYSFKGGKQIAEEMYLQHQKFGVDKFRFTDSLLNGNPKELLAMSERLIALKLDVIWHGQFICRDQRQHSPEHFDIFKKAGMDLLSIGIESGSEKIRYDMKKNFSNEALYYTLDQLNRVGIKLVPLMLVGYPTETEDDFQETLAFLDRLTNYSNIVDVNLNNPMRVLPGSPVGNNPEAFGLKVHRLETNHDFTANWEYQDNSYPTRIERFFRFHNRLLQNDLRRSYAGNDLRFYYDEYLSLSADPRNDVIVLMKSVIEGNPYEFDPIYRS